MAELPDALLGIVRVDLRISIDEVAFEHVVHDDGDR